MTRECYHFKKTGTCRFGESCHYKHIKKSSKVPLDTQGICQRFISKEGCKGGCKKAHAFKEDAELLELYKNGINIINIHANEITKLKEQMAMQLKLGEKDMYDLPTPTNSETSDTSLHQAQVGSTKPSSLTFSTFLHSADNALYRHEARAATNVPVAASQLSVHATPFTPISAVELTGDEYIRETQQIERLFRGRCQTLQQEGGTMFQVVMKPTDPDWNLTLLDVNLDIFVPVRYPAVNCTIEFTDERVSESTLCYINTAIKEELVMREGTMCLRPMLRWIDRNLADFLQCETQFHTYSSLKVHRKGGFSDSEDSDMEGDSSLAPPITEHQTGEFLENDIGTSIRLIDLDLHGSSHGLIPHNILLLIQCLRCKTQAEVLVEANNSRSIGCARCSIELTCKLYKKLCLPSISTLGCVELVGCTLADVLLSRSQVFSICTECSSSSFIGITPGSTNETWCSSCGHKMTVLCEGVKTVVITPPMSSGKQRARVKVSKGYTEGQSLPDKGTCSHYKKSQRWFRFTCCDRLFPCDKCHDAQFPDCPLEPANRMVCGLCAREQPVRGQCKFCHGDIAGTVRSHHWEGGKGCRDQVRMSNNDPKKHKNSKLKTHSQKDKRVGKKKDSTQNNG